MTASQLAERLEGRQRGKGWMAKCPGHDDQKASLSIDTGKDGKTVVHCHAGCQPSDIVEAAGLEMSDLFPSRSNSLASGRGRIVCEYNYRAEDGEVLYQVVRLDPKSFRQRKPRGEEWEWSVKGVRRVPYLLPELLAADVGAFVFIVEGEKDVDALLERGLVATCNAGGAGKWDKAFARFFEGRKVAVVADNDAPGRDHAEMVANSLVPSAASVRVVELSGTPPKGDVFDWLEAGGTAQELVAISEEQEVRLASSSSYLTTSEVVRDLFACTQLPTVKTPFPVLNDALGGGLMAGQTYVVSGGTGSGKTALAIQLAAGVAETAPVLFASYELPPRLIAARAVSQRLPGFGWLECIRGDVPAEEMLGCLPSNLHFAKRPALTELDDAVRRLSDAHGQVPLLVIDYLQLLGGALALSESISDVRAASAAASERIRELADTHGAPIVMVSAVSRGSNVRMKNARSLPPGDLVDVSKESGSIEYDAGAVIALSLGQKEDDQRQIATVSIAKNRFGRLLHIDYRFEGCSGAWTEVGEVGGQANNDLSEQIQASLRAAGVPLSKSAVIKRGGETFVKARKQTVFRDIDGMVERGVLQEVGGLLSLVSGFEGVH